MHTDHRVLAVHNGMLVIAQIRLSTSQEITGDEIGSSEVTYYCPRCGDKEFVPWMNGYIMCSGSCDFMVLESHLDDAIQEHVLLALDPKQLSAH